MAPMVEEKEGRGKKEEKGGSADRPFNLPRGVHDKKPAYKFVYLIRGVLEGGKKEKKKKGGGGKDRYPLLPPNPLLTVTLLT